MKVKVIKAYEDKNFKRIMNIGEVFEVDEDRYKVLTGNNIYKETYVEAVEEKIEEAVAPTPKKRTAKKKTTKQK